MRRFQLAVLFSFLVAGTLAHATDSGGSNGTLVSQEACPVLKGEYEQFVQGSRSGYEQEVQSAAKIGVTLPSMEERQRTLFDRATFESRVAHIGGG